MTQRHRTISDFTRNGVRFTTTTFLKDGGRVEQMQDRVNGKFVSAEGYMAALKAADPEGYNRAFGE